MTADDDLLSRNDACDSGAFTDDDVATLDVSLDNSVDLDVALADQIACDRKVSADDGNRPGCLCPGDRQVRPRLKRRRCVGFGD